MENSSYTYARLWLRTSARALLQCHKQLLDTDSKNSSNKANEDFLLQIKTYLDQLEVPELIEVIHHLTNEINKQCFMENMPEQKLLCYRGVVTEYTSDEQFVTNVNTTTIETPNQKKKVRYYRGVPME